jgi:oligopeptide transport system substrate-binding protein
MSVRFKCWFVCLVCLGAGNAGSASAQALHLGNTGEPQTLDPHRYNLRLEETILTDLFLGLTTFNARGEIVPGAALSWSTSEDGLLWTFKLRQGLKWSDGKPLTADDFVYSFRRLLDPATAASLAYFLYPIRNAEAVNAGRLPLDQLGVKAQGPATLLLELEAPYPHLAERLLYPTGYPVPRHVIAAVGDDWVKPEHWVSNGAYVLADWRPQAQVELVANPHFFTAPLIKQVFYHPLANEQNAYNRYRTGEMHAISTFPAGELESVRDQLAAHLRLSPLLSIVYLVFNTTQPPFDDARTRKALALAVDAEVLTDKVQRAGNYASKSFVPALVANYDSAPLQHYVVENKLNNVALTPQERQQQARALLAAAGYDAGNPLRLTLRYVSGTDAKRSNLAIAAFWKRIGVETQLHHSELKVHFSDLRQGDFQVAQAGWFGENNAEHYLGLLVSDTGDVNYGRYRNDEFDELMAHARTHGDVTQRNHVLRQAEELVMATYPVVPLYSVGIRRLVSPAISGWYENARDIHPARFLSWQ